MTATGANSPKLTVEQFNKRKKRRTDILPIVTDDDCSTAYELAEQQLNAAKAAFPRDDEAILSAQKLLAEAEKELREVTVIFRLQAMPREGDNSFAVLKAEHPPKDVDHDIVRDMTGDPKAKARWCFKTFEPAIVAATLIEPAVTVEQAAAWAQEWNDGEWNRLVNKAIAVNQTATDVRGLSFS